MTTDPTADPLAPVVTRRCPGEARLGGLSTASRRGKRFATGTTPTPTGNNTNTHMRLAS